ncbi:MAG: hypothetical protein IPL15_23295 [Comamonadaceae bacterium]|nr:hypothetical protein [Comamonadaceae bacterium]
MEYAANDAYVAHSVSDGAPIGNLVSKTFDEGKLNNGDRAAPDIYRGVPETLWFTQNLARYVIVRRSGANHQSDRGVSIYNC